jgi:hypothetical protein
MVSTLTFRESRRSTRVPLKAVIDIEGGRISIRLYLTDKRAARVVYIDPENPLRCGIELDEPRNIWGVRLPPDDWEETGAFEIRH